MDMPAWKYWTTGRFATATAMYQQAGGDFSPDYHPYFLPNGHHLSSLNLHIDPGAHFSPLPQTPVGPPVNKYQRTKSFDSLNFGGHLSFQPAPPPYEPDISLHSAESAYGYRVQELYKPRPPLNNFNANSCVPGGATLSNRTAQNNNRRMASVYRSFNVNCPPPLPPPRVSPLLTPAFPSNATLLAPRLLQLQQQQQKQLQHQQQKESPDSFGYMEPSMASSKRKFFDKNNGSRLTKNKLRVACIVAVMIGMIGLLVAMGVAVWSQVKTQTAIGRYVRQYQAQFMVTEGPLLQFNPALLNSWSPEFEQEAKLLVEDLDKMFAMTQLEAVYIASEIVAFRFHREIPAVEVHLNVKTQVNASVREVELLAMMDEAIRSKLNGVNSHAVIDPDSLRVENKSLREYWESQARQHSPHSLIKTRQFA